MKKILVEKCLFIAISFIFLLQLWDVWTKTKYSKLYSYNIFHNTTLATGIGRTGRVGNVGKATSFYDDKVDRNLAADLVKHSYRKTHEAILKYVTL